MKRKVFAISLFVSMLLLAKPFYAQLPQVMLTDSAKVSLITCSQGEELYSIFGHSAIRIVDPVVGVDWVFNYGTFDFSDPNFYSNFVKGKLNYILSVSSYQNFKYSYIFEERYIYEQMLNLQQHEKQLLLDSLRINYLPENRYYLYDFLFDNCATRIRDVFVEVIPRKVDFDYNSLKTGLSFRELLMPNVMEKPWAKLGINLLLGVSADRQAEPWEYMFLPEHMQTAFSTASVGVDSLTKPLMQPSVTLLNGTEIPRTRFRESPLMVFIGLLLLVVMLSYFDIKRGRASHWIDTVFFTLVGLLGVVIAFQWFGSNHVVMGNNYNLIWAHPLHLLGVVALLVKRLRLLARYYFGVNALVMVLVMILWFILPQELPFPMFPVVAAMAIRSAIIFKFNIDKKIPLQNVDA